MPVRIILGVRIKRGASLMLLKQIEIPLRLYNYQICNDIYTL